MTVSLTVEQREGICSPERKADRGSLAGSVVRTREGRKVLTCDRIFSESVLSPI